MDAQVVDGQAAQVDQYGNPVQQFSNAELASIEQLQALEAANARVRGAANAVDQAISQARYINVPGERNGIRRRSSELSASGHGAHFVTDNQGRVSAVVELDVHRTTTHKSRIPFLTWSIREPRPVATVAITINVNEQDQLSASVGPVQRGRFGFVRNPMHRLSHREARGVVRASRNIASHLEATHVVAHPDLQVAAAQVSSSDTRYIVANYRARQEARAARDTDIDLDAVVDGQLAARASDADVPSTYIAPFNSTKAEPRPTLAKAFMEALALAGTREHARREANRYLDEQIELAREEED